MNHDAPRTSKLDRILVVPFFSGYMGGMVTFLVLGFTGGAIQPFFAAIAGGVAAMGLEAFGNAARGRRRAAEVGRPRTSTAPKDKPTRRLRGRSTSKDDTGPAKLDEPTKPVHGERKQPRAKRRRG